MAFNSGRRPTTPSRRYQRSFPPSVWGIILVKNHVRAQRVSKNTKKSSKWWRGCWQWKRRDQCCLPPPSAPSLADRCNRKSFCLVKFSLIRFKMVLIINHRSELHIFIVLLKHITIIFSIIKISLVFHISLIYKICYRIKKSSKIALKKYSFELQ